MPVVSGICNTREKIAKSINCEVSEITQKIIDAMENPIKVDKFTDFGDYDTIDADLDKIPILTHYKGTVGHTLPQALSLHVTLKPVFRMHQSTE